MKFLITTLKILAATGIIIFPHTGQCFYNPSSGKWLSRDPMKDVAFQGDARGYENETAASDFNAYGFVDSRPTVGIDGYGLFSIRMDSFNPWPCGGWYNKWKITIEPFAWRNKVWLVQE